MDDNEKKEGEKDKVWDRKTGRRKGKDVRQEERKNKQMKGWLREGRKEQRNAGRQGGIKSGRVKKRGARRQK